MVDVSVQMASADNRAGEERLPDPEELRLLLETSASSQWMADPTHANMAQVWRPPAKHAQCSVVSHPTSNGLVKSLCNEDSFFNCAPACALYYLADERSGRGACCHCNGGLQVLTHEVDAHGPGGDGLAELTALLGTDDWAPLNTSAQAALAQASDAMTPALPADPSSGRPPLPDSRPRHPQRAATAMPSPAEIRAIGGSTPGQSPPTRPPTPRPFDTHSVSGQSSGAEQATEHALPYVRTQESSTQGSGPANGAESREGGTIPASSAGGVPASVPLTEEGKAEFVKVLTAKIAEAAQQAALDAISSSVDVRIQPPSLLFLLSPPLQYSASLQASYAIL